VSLTAGVMQAFDFVFANFGIQWLTPIVGLAIVAASLAGFLTWLAGPSKSLLLVAKDGGGSGLGGVGRRCSSAGTVRAGVVVPAATGVRVGW
ncbi:MAG: hypothetical protein ACRDGH_03410, partial [Candidatus Limnocylindria bacterium]